MSQLLRCSYCLKNFSIPYLMFVFLILVSVFNVSQFFYEGIFLKIFKKLH